MYLKIINFFKQKSLVTQLQQDIQALQNEAYRLTLEGKRIQHKTYYIINSL